MSAAGTAIAAGLYTGVAGVEGVTVDREVTTPSSLLIVNGSVATVTVDVVAGGAMCFTNAALQVNRGGVLRVVGGDFSFDSTRVRSFLLRSGAWLDLTGGTAEIYNVPGSDNVFNMEAGSRLTASGDAVLDLCGSRKRDTYLRGSEITLSEDAQLKVCHIRFVHTTARRRRLRSAIRRQCRLSAMRCSIVAGATSRGRRR